MSALRNIRDLDDRALPNDVRARVRSFVDRGFSRDHLVVSETGQVFLDRELVENDAFDQVFLGSRAVDP